MKIKFELKETNVTKTENYLNFNSAVFDVKFKSPLAEKIFNTLIPNSENLLTIQFDVVTDMMLSDVTDISLLDFFDKLYETKSYKGKLSFLLMLYEMCIKAKSLGFEKIKFHTVEGNAEYPSPELSALDNTTLHVVKTLPVTTDIRQNLTLFDTKTDIGIHEFVSDVSSHGIIPIPFDISKTPLIFIRGNILGLLNGHYYMSCEEKYFDIFNYAVISNLKALTQEQLTVSRLQLEANSRTDNVKNIVNVYKKDFVKNLQSKIDNLRNRKNELLKELEVTIFDLTKSEKLIAMSNKEKNENIEADIRNSLIQIAQLKPVEVCFLSKDILIIRTKELACFHEVNNNWHKIGKFEIHIKLDGNREIKWFNLSRRVVGYSGLHHAPHVFPAGNACLGNASSMIAECQAKNDLYGLAVIAIQFPQSVYLSDPAGRKLDRWPIIKKEQYENYGIQHSN